MKDAEQPSSVTFAGLLLFALAAALATGPDPISNELAFVLLVAAACCFALVVVVKKK